MSCDLSDDALYILNILYTDRCFASNRGYHSKKLERILSRKTSSNHQNIIRELQNGGYITAIKKSELKYYISCMPKTVFALNSHGFSVTKGKTRKL